MLSRQNFLALTQLLPIPPLTFSGENPVKMNSELWQTIGCCGVCAPINGIKKAIPEVCSRLIPKGEEYKVRG